MSSGRLMISEGWTEGREGTRKGGEGWRRERGMKGSEGRWRKRGKGGGMEERQCGVRERGESVRWVEGGGRRKGAGIGGRGEVGEGEGGGVEGWSSREMRGSS